MNMKAGLWALALCCTLAPEARGGEAGQASDSYALGEVVVSGNCTDGGPGAEASQTLYTVDADQIKASGARTLDQALRLLPGVNVRTGAEGVPRIDIRGFRTRHVLLLLDGVPMNSALDMQFDPTTIPTENIAEIKLTSGASSVLYGQGGLGGVINIITRKGTPGVHGTISGEFGDHAPYLAKGTLSAATDRFSYFLSGSGTKVDAFPLAGDFAATANQGSGYRANSDRERRNFLGTIGFTPTADVALGLTMSYSEGSYGKPAGTIVNPIDTFASPPKYARVDGFSGLYLQLAGECALSEHFTLRGWGYLNRSDQDLNQYDDARLDSFQADGSFRERVHTSIYGATLQPRYDFGKGGTLTFSFGAERDGWENAGVQAVNLVSGGTPSYSDLAKDRSLSLYSAGVEYELSPVPGLGLVAGYGWYWQHRSELAQDDYSFLLGANYDFATDTRLKASFKRNVRFPSLGDLYDISKGNELLATETSRSVEAGIEQKLPREARVALTGFYTEAKNLIQNDQTTGHNMNLSEVRFAGAELQGEARPMASLLLRAGYTYLHSEDRSRPGREEVQYNPRDKVTLEARYDARCGGSAYLAVNHVANQYFYTKDNVPVVQKAKLNDYTVVNLRLSQKVLQDRVTLYVGANNLFDQNYETSYGFPQPGRYIYGGFEYRL
ncbi:TonB-dependent receptor [Geomonas propionica]|uniref:TonB-dependent receptor n=1 Tax=Geomonas propionica TaxID=2798582 RepID=A0ABS0YXT2_9BACT|nr:TonB-dependent receptor [Geomonas propionica]MBJ6802786.1 TonB-dependent receptor [Geomonas propionica]